MPHVEGRRPSACAIVGAWVFYVRHQRAHMDKPSIVDGLIVAAILAILGGAV